MLQKVGCLRQILKNHDQNLLKRLLYNKQFHIDLQKKSIQNIRFLTTCDNNSNSLKPNDPIQNNVIQNAIKSFRANPYVRIMRLDRPIGSWLLFWPCGWSIALSASPGCLPDLSMLALFAAGSVIMRGAGCTINDLWDKDIDAKVQRTSTRPLVTKELTKLDAWFFLGAQLGTGLLILLQLNWNSILLGVSSLCLVIVYPLMKRITNWPQLVLGLTFNWGALLGYSAVHGEVLWSACLPLYAAGVCWTIVYDTIYAHQDRVDDLIIGVKSTALRFGRDTKKWLTGFSGVMITSLLTTGYVCDLSWPYYTSILITSAHIAHQIYTLNIDNPSDCAKKFISNNHVGLILFGGILLGVLMQNPESKKNKDPSLIFQSLTNSQHKMFWHKKNKILSKAQLKHLSDHKYNCTSDSYLDKILQVWWCWLVSKTPLYIAPNLLTIVGLFVNILTSVILIWYAPDAKVEAPRWCYLSCAIGLFIYQSLDAIDGKQARRTNTSSPLGELFDHGCDSISTVFVSISACCASGLGNHPSAMFLNCTIAVILFYVAHWQTYITGTLKFGKFDVTEAQFCIIFIHTMSFFFGIEVWRTKILGTELWFGMAIFYISTSFLVLANFCRIFSTGGIGKNGSTVAGTSIISPILPFLLVIIPAFIISEKSRSGLYANHPVLYMLTFGLLAAKVSCRLVVAHMSKSEMNYFDSEDLVVMANDYSDLDRAILQTTMGKGTIEEKEFHCIYNKMRKIFLPQETIIPDNSFVQSIEAINEKISTFDQKIILYEYGLTDEKFYVFASTAKTSMSKMQDSYNETELDFFKLILAKIIENEDLLISPRAALNLTSHITGTKITKMRAQKLLDNWTQSHYFFNQNNNIYLGAKLLTEFKELLQSMDLSYLKSCLLCECIALWGKHCALCGTTYHSSCIQTYLSKSGKCPSCKEKWIVNGPV
ncbi:CLUMA_CG009035, isoform A [Clunio marinus]|uniref:4-hydroxybenzoate polyprenyltransferase, mitochondrial n=1 Tax=Clunio marinus TaxID=568069 RepID=A0A1J1I5W1_9DIPT|nr:CLUMA_CG009035, isoform A [Clunio marinus]